MQVESEWGNIYYETLAFLLSKCKRVEMSNKELNAGQHLSQRAQ